MQINFSAEQMKELKRLAQISDVSVEDYIKLKLFGNPDDVDLLVKKALTKIKKLPSGEDFNIRQLFGTDWNHINRGTKLSLGKKMLVESKKNDSIFQATSKDSKNTQWYRKK